MKVWIKGTVVIILSVMVVTACQDKLLAEDLRNIMPKKEPISVDVTKDQTTLSYKKGALTTSDINTYIRTLMDDYDYKITQAASNKGDDILFTLSHKKDKTISFIIYGNGKVDIEYNMESK